MKIRTVSTFLVCSVICVLFLIQAACSSDFDAAAAIPGVNPAEKTFVSAQNDVLSASVAEVRRNPEHRPRMRNSGYENNARRERHFDHDGHRHRRDACGKADRAGRTDKAEFETDTDRPTRQHRREHSPRDRGDRN